MGNKAKKNKGGRMRIQALKAKETYLTEAEVSRLTGRAKSTLQKDRVCRVGIPYIKMGHTVRYLLQDVHDYMQANRIETAPNN